jgi:hypothetical protein
MRDKSSLHRWARRPSKARPTGCLRRRTAGIWRRILTPELAQLRLQYFCQPMHQRAHALGHVQRAGRYQGYRYWRTFILRQDFYQYALRQKVVDANERRLNNAQARHTGGQIRF